MRLSYFRMRILRKLRQAPVEPEREIPDRSVFLPSVLYVHNSVKEEFTRRLVEQVREIEVGYDDNVEEMMEKFLGNTDRTNTKGEYIGSLISEKAAKEVEAQVQHTIDQGAKLECGGSRTGAFYMPDGAERRNKRYGCGEGYGDLRTGVAGYRI